MSNHCINVVCCLCAHTWCLRGCGEGSKLSISELDDIIPRPDNIKVATRCPHCGDDSYVVIL